MSGCSIRRTGPCGCGGGICWQQQRELGEFRVSLKDALAAETAAKDAAERERLRDDFAKAALIGIEASQGNSGSFISTVEMVAVRAYQLADAMLRAREAE